MSYAYNVKRVARASRERAKRNAETARLLGSARAGLAPKKLVSGVSGALITVSLFGALAAISYGCLLFAATGPTPAINPVASATPSPTTSPSPSPIPSPTVKAESCVIDYMVLQPRDGLILAKGEVGRLSLTPYQTVTNPDGTVAQREVSKPCNLPRIPSIIWTSTSAAVIVGTGFEPLVTREGVGTALVSATLEGKISNSITVR